MWKRSNLFLYAAAISASAVDFANADPISSLRQQQQRALISPSIDLAKLDSVDFAAANGVSSSASTNVPRAGGADTPTAQQIAGVVVFALIEVAFRKLFKANGIRFPGQLAGCVFLFVFMILAQIVSPGLGDAICNALSPGSGLLAKWMGVFFVPGLTMLPLAPSVGSPLEVRAIESRMVGLSNYGFFSCSCQYEDCKSLRCRRRRILLQSHVGDLLSSGRSQADGYYVCRIDKYC